MAKKKRKRTNNKGGCLGVLIFLVVIIIGIGVGSRIWQEYNHPLRYETYIEKYSNQYGVDDHLVMAIVRTESNFIHDAQSNKNAKGLMQIMDDTAYWIAKKMDMDSFTIEDLNDPETNIKMGTWYVSWLLEKFDENEETALAAYNGGIGNVNKWLKDDRYSADGKTLLQIPYQETRNYVEKVERYKRYYEKEH